jgi:hypothetical protein
MPEAVTRQCKKSAAVASRTQKAHRVAVEYSLAKGATTMFFSDFVGDARSQSRTGSANFGHWR